MGKYRLYKHGCAGPFKLIPIKRFYLPAFLLGPLWPIACGAYVEAAGFIVLFFLMWSAGLHPLISILVVNCIISYSGLAFIDRGLRARGWCYITSIDAPNKAEAKELFADPFKSLKGKAKDV